MVGGGGNKVVATLRADGNVYPTEGAAIVGQLANLMNYKIRTDGELMGGKSLNTLSVPTTVVDLGKQLLQFARDSDLKGVKNILSRGAPFTSDWLGMSALHFAAVNNQFEMCSALLKAGINKDSKTKVDRTPLHLACFCGNERIVELLLSKKCAVNPRDMLRMTPLHWAVEKGYKAIVRLLLKHNAEVTLVSKFGKTPIALAVLTEQADLLEELEAARQTQASRKYNEEHEKETSEAVNSIMGIAAPSTEVIVEPDAIRKMDVDTEDELTNQSDYADANFDGIKETGVLDNSTIDLLKSHGISMMQDDDDTSKDLLNTALQNGRQLVLSEGGKLLLNEANKTQNNNTNINNNNNNINNNHNSIVPLTIKNEIASPVPTQIPKMRPNIISKAKDNPGMSRNKNIRIISLNDFKKLYGNTNLKAMQKIPASLASSRVPRQLSEESKTENVERRMYVNVRQTQNRQLKIPAETAHVEENNSKLIEEDDHMSNIIQIGPSDSEAEASDIEQAPTPQQPQPQLQQHHIKTAQPVRIIPARRVEHMGTVQVRQMPVAHKQHQQQMHQQNINKIGAPANASIAASIAPSLNTTKQSSSSVIPLLTMPEVCRQLLELRKQNEELRRRIDLAQKEKEEMRQRLDRLEELLLVEKTDEDYAES